MKINSLCHYITAALSILAILASSNNINNAPIKKYSYVPPSLEIKRFTLGFDDTFADVLWLRFVQDFGFCEQDRSALGSPFNEKTGARRGKDRVPECSFGWGYHMINLIIELAPRFETAATSGAIALSVIADDIDGARAIFDKNVINFPKNWEVFYQAGYHYLFEVEDKEKAVELYLKASTLGAPEWVPLLVARLSSQIGKDDVAASILNKLIEQVKDRPDIIKRAQEKLKRIAK